MPALERNQARVSEASGLPEVAPALVKVDQFDFFGNVNSKKLEEIAHKELPLYFSHRQRTFATEAVKTPEQVKALTSVRQAVNDYALALGIDLSDRIPDKEFYRFFPHQEAYSAALDQIQAVAIEHESPACLKPEGIFLQEVEDPLYQTAILIHETLHEVSHKLFEIHKSRRGVEGYVHLGFKYLPGSGMEEWVTDIATAEITSRMRFEETTYGYRKLNLIGAVAVQEAASRLNIAPDYIFHELVKDKFIGSEMGLAMLKEGLGKRRFDYLVSLDIEGSLDAYKRVAHHLGLVEAVRQLELIAAQQPDDLERHVAIMHGEALIA